MIILGFDTSCDETSVSLIDVQDKEPYLKIKILSNIVSSQVKLHAKHGGVYPFLAQREHQKNLPVVLKKALRQAQGKPINFIGVTVGPGLEPCLWQGINFAKNLAQKLNLPIVPVNHMEAHILANFIGEKSQQNSKKIFPAVCLVVSGGHTQLILMKGIGKYELIGETRDDAAGECFDKAAKILGLGYPGGPAIAKMAKEFVRGRASIKLPRPMIYQKNYDFSFSGLKTAVLYDVRNRSPKIGKSKEYIRAMCFEIEQAIIDVLIHKTLKAAKNFKVKSVILGGGVTANNELRKQFKEKIKKEIPYSKLHIPDIKYCTDNAAMIAITAYFNQKKATKDWQKIKADANLKI